MNISLRSRIERLSVPEPNTGCWLWVGTLNNGYGMIGTVDGKRLAHRASYAEYVGDPTGKIVMHKCDTPACVNPDHLALGTHRDNAIDAARKLRTVYSQVSKEQRRAWSRQPSISGLKGGRFGLNLNERINRLSIPEPNTGCHLWLGPLNNSGYGKIKIDRRMCLAHRISYTATVGLISNGMMVLHKCDTPACVNPDHLFLGTARDNIADAMKKGRANMARVSATERVEWARKRVVQENGTRPDIARRGWETRREHGLEFTLTPEKSSERAKKGWAKLTPKARAARAQKMRDGRRLESLAKSGQQLDEELVPFVRHWAHRGHSIRSIALAFDVSTDEIERVVA